MSDSTHLDATAPELNSATDTAMSELADLHQEINRVFDEVGLIIDERDEAIQRAKKAEAALARALATQQESVSK